MSGPDIDHQLLVCDARKGALRAIKIKRTLMTGKMMRPPERAADHLGFVRPKSKRQPRESEESSVNRYRIQAHDAFNQMRCFSGYE